MTEREFKTFTIKRLPYSVHTKLKTKAVVTGNGLENLIIEILTKETKSYDKRSKK